MMQKPFISVVMPAYNAERYLKEAIDSVLAQSYTHFELILLNDGSTDSTENIILSYKDPRIRYIANEKNIGLIETLNKGIELSTGEFILRMDADDVCLPERFEKQVAFMNLNPTVGAAGTAYYSLSDKGLKKFPVLTEPGVLKSVLLFNSCLCHPSVIIRKSVLEQHAIRYNKNYMHSEDYGLWVELVKVSKLANLPDLLLKYRYHTGQISMTHNPTQKSNASLIREGYLKSLGFTFTPGEFKTHTQVSENQFIRSREELEKIEQWFLHLSEQNAQINSLVQKDLLFILGKMWYDSCGFNNLGLWAFDRFFRSPLVQHYPVSFKQRSRLAVKCLVRKFK